MSDKSASKNKEKIKTKTKTKKQDKKSKNSEPRKDNDKTTDDESSKENETEIEKDPPLNGTNNSNETYEPKISRFCLPMDFAESILIWKLHSYEVVTPSYPVLLNHTIGVLWYLFEDPNNINSLVKTDISWALRFIEQINSTRIADTRDLKCMTQYLRNALTWKYANEDENQVEELENSFIEKNLTELPHSHSLSEYDSCLEVQEMLKDERAESSKQIITLEPCNNQELIRRLRELQNTQPQDRKIETIEQLYSLLDQTI